MKKKGFTLVELLATIVIIAVIATITVGIVLGVIENSKEGAFKASALNVLDAADYYAMEKELDLNSEPLENPIDISSLNIKNKDKLSGEVTSENGEFTLLNVTDGNYCANGTRTNLVIEKNPCGSSSGDGGETCDPSVIISGNTTSSTSYSASDVTLTAKGNDTCNSGVSSYQWYKDGSAISGATSSTYKATTSGTYGVAITYVSGQKSATYTTVVYIDKTSPLLNIGTITLATNSATINFTTSDSGSGIKSTTCVFGTSTNYGTSGTVSGSVCTMVGLAEDTTYYYKITTTDNAGNTTTKTGSISTPSSGGESVTTTQGITFSVDKTGWDTWKYVTIDYSNTEEYNSAETPIYLFKVVSSTNASVLGWTNGYCWEYNSDDIPNSDIGYHCDFSSSVSSLSKDTWYAVNTSDKTSSDSQDSVITLKLSSNDVIKAIAIDYSYYEDYKTGTGLGNPDTYTVSKIDTTEPTISMTTSGSSIKLSMSDSESGLSSYCVGTSSSSTSCSSWVAISGTSATATYTPSASGTYYGFVKDGVGRVGSTSVSFTKPITYAAYSVGDAVTYNSVYGNTTWYVVQNSPSTSSTVRIMSRYALNSSVRMNFCDDSRRSACLAADTGAALYRASSVYYLLNSEGYSIPTESDADNYWDTDARDMWGSDGQFWIYDDSYDDGYSSTGYATYFDAASGRTVEYSDSPFMNADAYLVPAATVSKSELG